MQQARQGRPLPDHRRRDVCKRVRRCGYVKTADPVEPFSNPAALDPAQDPDIVGTAGIFGANFDDDGEFRKTASVMKMVIDGNAGAGTISMGGFDYHTGDRIDRRSARLPRRPAAWARAWNTRRVSGKPLMLYVFSDGSLSSNGMIDNSVGGRGKGVWTGDNQQTAAAFFLVYNPTRATPALMTARARRDQQIGYFRAGRRRVKPPAARRRTT